MTATKNSPELGVAIRRTPDAPLTASELDRLLDERAALAIDPKREKFTLKQIAARHGVEL